MKRSTSTGRPGTKPNAGVANGSTSTRPREFVDWQRAAELYQKDGWTYAKIARHFACQAATIALGLKRHGVARRSPPPRKSPPVFKDPQKRALHAAWTRMKQRCSNPKASRYEYYGGRGIRVCPQWRSSFDAFAIWARAHGFEPGLSLARIDHDRGYSPANCRWATRAEATRASGKSHRGSARAPRWTVSAFGETKGPTEWARDERCNVKKGALLARLHAGWKPEEAISLPPLQDIERDPKWAITAFGQTKGLLAWAEDRRCKVTASGLLQRIRKGIAPEEAITTDPYRL